MNNMKNITSYSDFKEFRGLKLNEEVEFGKDPFINVKGNFAGADQTLVGSAVIKLFNFVKRKGMQVLLYTYYKPNLYKEYMSGLLRYIIRNNMALPKEKTIFDIFSVKDVEGNVLEKQEQFKVTFTLEESGTTTHSQRIGSVVKTEKDESLKDGWYKIKGHNTGMFKLVDSKITEIDYETLSDYNPILEDADTNVSGQTETEEPVQAEQYILEFIEKLKAQFQSKDDVADKEVIAKAIKEIDDLIKFFNDSIAEMNELLKDDEKQSDEINRIKKDLDIYKENLKTLETYKGNVKSLENLKVEIQKPKVAPAAVATTSPVTAQVESFQLNEEIIGKAATAVAGGIKAAEKTVGGQIKPGEQKVTSNKIIGDELNKLSQVDIDLNDLAFTKQFTDPEIRKKVTLVVLEGKSEIVKIQLSAERLYQTNDGKIDRKLQNNWLKMVQTVKQQFSKFMLIDQIDPVYLRNQMDKGEVAKLEAEKNGNGGVMKDVSDLNKKKDNTNLDQILPVGDFANQQVGTFGMVDYCNPDPNTGTTKIVYCQGIVQMKNGKSYKTYQVVGSVRLKELLEDKSGTTYNQYIEKFPKVPVIFRPKAIPAGEKHIATFIIGSENHLTKTVISKKLNYVTILYVFAKNNLNKIDNTCTFYYRNTDGADTQLMSTVPFDRKSEIPIAVGQPWLISIPNQAKFGLETKDIVDISTLPSMRNDLVQIKK